MAASSVSRDNLEILEVFIRAIVSWTAPGNPRTVPAKTGVRFPVGSVEIRMDPSGDTAPLPRCATIISVVILVVFQGRFPSEKLGY